MLPGIVTTHVQSEGSMEGNELANMIEGLRAIGFSEKQITDFILMIAGRISIEEWVQCYNELKN